MALVIRLPDHEWANSCAINEVKDLSNYVGIMFDCIDREQVGIKSQRNSTFMEPI